MCRKVNAFCTVEYRDHHFSVENDELSADRRFGERPFLFAIDRFPSIREAAQDDGQKSKDCSAMGVVVWTGPIFRIQGGTTLRHVLQKSSGLVRRG